MTVKRQSSHPKSSEPGHHYQIQFSVILFFGILPKRLKCIKMKCAIQIYLLNLGQMNRKGTRKIVINQSSVRRLFLPLKSAFKILIMLWPEHCLE